MTTSQRALAAFFTFAGVMHFVIPKRTRRRCRTTCRSPLQDAVVYSGYAEIAGALAVIPPATRGIARWWLIALLVAVFPANVHMAVNPEQVTGPRLRPDPALGALGAPPAPATDGLVGLARYRGLERPRSSPNHARRAARRRRARLATRREPAASPG